LHLLALAAPDDVIGRERVRGGLGGQLTTEEAVPMHEHAGAPAVRRGGWRSRSNGKWWGLKQWRWRRYVFGEGEEGNTMDNGRTVTVNN
jgi:hypothetical protein